MQFAKKLLSLDHYVFYELEQKKRRLECAGLDVVDLSIGDPDLPTPAFVISHLAKATGDYGNLHYPSYIGLAELRHEIANYYKIHYDVTLDPDTEVAILIGSKEGIAHLILALTDPGDSILIPDLGYPVYKSAAAICSCNCSFMKLTAQNKWLPNLKGEVPKINPNTKLVLVNYPNNPTGACATRQFFEDLVQFAKLHNLVAVNDGAYMDIVSQDQKRYSLLQAKDAMDCSIEFGSFSKSYCMTGWRLGYAIGNHEIIAQLMKVKTNFDSGQFTAVQQAGIEAMKNGNDTIKQLNIIYDQRKELFRATLTSIGIHCADSPGTFYLWADTPQCSNDIAFSERLLNEAGILVAPGSVFGQGGANKIRFSMTAAQDRLQLAIQRLLMFKL